MQKNNKLYLILMVGSILVLILVQFFWLASVYKDYKNSLKQETRLLFATTVTGMLDSLVLKDLNPVFIPGLLDTVYGTPHFRNFSFQDTLRSVRIEVKSEPNGKDTILGSNRQIQIITTGDSGFADSLKRVFRPLMMGIDSIKEARKFTYRINREPLDPQTIEIRFNEVLAENDCPLEAKVRRYDVLNEANPIPANAISLEEIRIPFGTRIVGYIETYRGFLFKKMLNPFLFALLVVLFISWSMFAMYRNMLKQQRLNLLKNDIISNITHELKTPVSTVAIILESLENFGAKDNLETRKEYIQIAKNELKRLTAMAENILKSSVLEKEEKVNFRPLELEVLLEDRINSFKPMLQSQSFEFRYQKQGNQFKIYGNEEQLSLVIFNLLDNAIKYSKDIKSIDIHLHEMDYEILLKISDKGIGIPEGYQKEIFEKFIRVPQHDLHDVKGYGLGLAQVAAVIQSHGGKIFLDSQLGKGSSFTIQFQKI
ncbi:sensor histidine kinase [Aquiflexum sp.]|uniref:sensor histidine kinase n=1 Tax=Aquiflexum sp. TaxID=1872584 RepID=UPI003593F9FB